MTEQRKSSEKIGAWLIGALGGVATTTIVGARLIARGLAPTTGMLTATASWAALGLSSLESIVFGGHDVRRGDLVESAQAIARAGGGFSLGDVLAIESDLKEISKDIRLGVARRSGKTIESFAVPETVDGAGTLRSTVDRLAADIADFKSRHGLDRVVVVNIASTEPPLELGAEHKTVIGFESLIAGDRWDRVQPSALYGWAAIREGAAWINFTPTNAGLLEAHRAFADARGVPLMGSDGKTGETLVKTALAPMFRERNLHVLTWHGYNMLGDRDGVVLADGDNKSSKIATKNSVLESILGYRPESQHVDINFAPSLGDQKTAWDFIHFAGFLGFKMSLQFTWQGCDSILAAPLVLDMIRLAAFAQGKGEKGLMTHLGAYFKRPEGVPTHDFFAQARALEAYAERHLPKSR